MQKNAENEPITSEAITTHYVPYNLLGVLAMLPAYRLGDWVGYGGALYKPAVSGGDGLYLSDEHRAHVHYTSGGGASFYCS